MITVKTGAMWLAAFCVVLAYGGLFINPIVSIVFGLIGLPASAFCVSSMYNNYRIIRSPLRTATQPEEVPVKEESEKAEEEAEAEKQPEEPIVDDPRIRGLFEE